MFLVRQDDMDKNLYVSHFTAGRWSAVEALPDPVNSPWDETHACISGDKRTLCFTSNRPGGEGAMDIYFSTRMPDGSWSKPANAGKPVNSLYSEETPFLTEDGKTLYFSSMGHATMGGFDLFYSTRLPSGSWSVPANLGFPISTCDDDLFFFPLGDGTSALFCSAHQPLPEGRVEWIRFDVGGPVRNYRIDGTLTADDNRELSDKTRVEVINNASGDTVSTLTPEPRTGKYTAEVNPGDYHVVITSDRYTADTLGLSIKPGMGRGTIPLETHLTPQTVTGGKYILVRNVLFGFDSSEINDPARFELAKLCQVMTAYPDLYVQVRGHADSKGSTTYNLNLSRQRARSVVDFLVSNGISRERFISSGVGENENVARNENPDGTDNPEGRRLNRQVEITLINNHYGNVSIRELEVPENLKPMRDRRYYILLGKKADREPTFPAEVSGMKVKLFETEHGFLYTAGAFAGKSQATGYLNTVIDEGFPDAILLDEPAFKRMLAVSDLSPGEMNGPFTIQILALRNGTIFPDFPDPASIQLFEGQDGFHRYVTGVFETYAEAHSLLGRYVEAGYTDAFVMPLSKYTSLMGEGTDGSDPEFYFTIQLTAVKSRPDSRIYSRIADVRITRGKDGFYRISKGIFRDKSEAEKMLILIRGEGFPDAFIRKINKQLSPANAPEAR